jgi:ubiquinone/menaquinone biosynthesis C-methylase UbiE
MYEASANSYAEMMDSEIDLPVYSDVLGRLSERIAKVPGLLIDTSCGSGHMLSMYHEHYDPRRELLGIDLSSRMVAIAGSRLGSAAELVVGDMRDLSLIEAGSAAAVISFFGLHHLDPGEVGLALREWHRVLRSGGQLVMGVWEGAGAIDYGDEYEIVALRYSSDEISSWTQAAGFIVTRCVTESVEGFPMDAVYLEGEKN